MALSDAANYAATWRARLQGGRAVINAVHPLNAGLAAPQISGCDGQDLGGLLLEGYPGHHLDGGNLDANTVELPYAPQRGNGGEA